MLGVTHDTYMLWERDEVRPYPQKFPAIVAFVGYDPLPAPTTEGERRKRERLLLGLTSQQMADRLGIDQGTLLKREGARVRRAKRIEG